MHYKQYEKDEKILVELMNRLPHFITKSIYRSDELTRLMNPFSFKYFSVIFLKTIAFDLLVLCSLKRDSSLKLET